MVLGLAIGVRDATTRCLGAGVGDQVVLAAVVRVCGERTAEQIGVEPLDGLGVIGPDLEPAHRAVCGCLHDMPPGRIWRFSVHIQDLQDWRQPPVGVSTAVVVTTSGSRWSATPL